MSDQDVPVPGDTKDWTWVLTRPCEECGFDAQTLSRTAIPLRLQQAADDLAVAMDRPDARQRPAPGVWSALEYACHVRDVTGVFLERLNRMLTEDSPAFANWDQDATAIALRYGEQDPAEAARELRIGAAQLAAAFAAVPDDAWERTATRSDGAVFTIESLGRYLVHDPVHHVWDISPEQAH